MPGGSTVAVRLIFIRETDQAVLFRDENDRELWLPRSTFTGIEYLEPDEGDVVTVDVAEWKATQEGLI